MQGSQALAVFVQSERAVPALGRDSGPVAEFVSSALHLDAAAIERGIKRMRRRYPGESEVALARRCATNAAWLAGGASLVLSLPDHPALVIAATMVESLVLQRIRVVAMAQIAMLHESRMLRAGLDPVGPLRAMAGRHPKSEAAAAQGSTAWREASVAAMPRLTKIEAAHVVSALCKGAELNVCSRKALKLIPVVGAVAGAVASANAVRREIEGPFAHLDTTLVPQPGANVAAFVRRLARPRGTARRAAVEIVAAGIRTSDVLAAATRRSRGAISTLLAEARSRARISSDSECIDVAA